MNDTDELPPAALRLVRETPWESNLGCNLAIAALVGGIGAAVVTLQWLLGVEEDNAWVVYVVGWAFVGVAALIVFAGVHRHLAVRSPETIIGIEGDEIHPGSSLRVHVIQPGPLQMKSLRVNLWGELVTTTPNPSYRPGSDRDPLNKRITHLGTFNFFEKRAFEIPSRQAFHGVAEMHVPADALCSGSTGDADTAEGRSDVTWRIEVWGKVRHAADFEHPFVIEVK